MALPHFSVRDIQFSIQLTGYIIVVTTDVPAHLWMRWTIEEIRKHFDPVIKRGASFPVKVRFCVVKYRDNEQAEAGDTLTHTFIKLNWPECQTRRFYFFGNVAGVWSPSESPLFEKHFKLPPMNGPFYAQIDASPWTEFLKYYVSGHTYAMAHGSANATEMLSSATRFSGQSKVGTNKYDIRRKPIYFDTSVIPDDAFIYGAILYVRISFLPASVKDMRIVSTPDISNPPVLADYGYILSRKDQEIYTLQTSDMTSGYRNHWKINALGLASINKTGITKWAMLSVPDVNASAPVVANEWLWLDNEKEHLTVIYYTPS